MTKSKISRIVLTLAASAAFGITHPMDSNCQEISEKTIHVIRERKFLGSGNKMDIQINSQSVYKLKNGRHLILKIPNQNSIDFQIVYPLMKIIKSEIWRFSDENETEIFLLASYQGAGKFFRINVEQLSVAHGMEILKNSKRFQKKTERIKIKPKNALQKVNTIASNDDSGLTKQILPVSLKTSGF